MLQLASIGARLGGDGGFLKGPVFGRTVNFKKARLGGLLPLAFSLS